MQSKRLLVFVLLTITCLRFYAQESVRLDSLLQESKKKHADSVQVDILNSIAWEYRNSEMDKVKVFADSALQLAEKINYYKGQVKSHFNIGNMYYIKGDFALTLQSYLQALSILEKIKDKAGIANALMGIGNIHAIQKNTEKAIEYQEKSLAIRIEIGDSLGMAGSYNNIGSIYTDLKEYDKALEYNFKSLKIKQKLNYWKGLSSSYGNIGAIYKEQGELKKAIKFQEKALEIRKQLNNMKGMAMSYTDIGNIYQELKQYPKALENQKKALEIAQKVSYKEGEVMALLSLSITSEKLKQYDKALDYYRSYSEQRDSLFSIQKSKEIADLESVHTAEKQKQQIEMLEKDNVIQDLKIKAQKKELSAEKAKRIAVYSVLALIICFVFFLIYTMIKRKKANRIIAHQKELVEEKNQEITDSITYAKRIQDSILPANELVKESFPQSFIYYRPKDIVAGDFYWMESYTPSKGVANKTTGSSPSGESEGDVVLFAVADCTGHGVPGAMVSVICYTALNRVIREYKISDPGQILNKTSDIVVKQLNKSKVVDIMGNIKDGMDIALCSIKLEDGSLKYAGANNPLWIIKKGEEEILEVKGIKQAVGKSDNPQSFQTHELKLNKGDTIYIFSDGYADQFGGHDEESRLKGGKKFSYISLKKLLLSICNEEMDQQQELIDKALKKWMGNLEQVDDICLMGIRI